MNKITVIGAGLAGCEAAWQAANAGIFVELHEMKPQKTSPAHSSSLFAELVCSNSLRSNDISNATGLLKQELRMLGSLIMEAADLFAIPAGSALAVDREKFSEYITRKISSHPNIRIINGEVTHLDKSGVQIVATGPLTSDALSDYIAKHIGGKRLHFYDAAAPIIDAASIEMDKVFAASRYGKGEPCYLNCPMTAKEYDDFYHALITAKEAPLSEFEKDMPALFTDSVKDNAVGTDDLQAGEAGLRKNNEPVVFEGCIPVEVMARRGYDTLRYGPMKPIGLLDPKTGQEAFAVVQLRREDEVGTMYNIVGFQTRLTFPEQRRVFGMIPGLASADFLRYGVMHRNTFIDSPRILDNVYSMKSNPDVFFAGQITGVEGYIPSCASGFVAGLNAARRVLGLPAFVLPDTTQIGALAAYISRESVVNFQPMNANFGILPPLDRKVKGGKSARHRALAEKALTAIDEAVKKLKTDETESSDINLQNGGSTGMVNNAVPDENAKESGK